MTVLPDIETRYRQRRAAGRLGWADADSYDLKLKRVAWAMAWLTVAGQRRFLELGSGAGNVALALAGRGFAVTGVDLSEEAIAWARDEAQRQNLPGRFLVADATTLAGLPDEGFEFVFDADCLLMVVGEARGRCLASVRRVLGRDGVFLTGANLAQQSITSQLTVATGAAYDPVTRRLLRAGVPYYQLSTATEFRQELRTAGFAIVAEQETPINDPQQQFLEGHLSVVAVKSPQGPT